MNNYAQIPENEDKEEYNGLGHSSEQEDKEEEEEEQKPKKRAPHTTTKSNIKNAYHCE